MRKIVFFLFLFLLIPFSFSYAQSNNGIGNLFDLTKSQITISIKAGTSVKPTMLFPFGLISVEENTYPQEVTLVAYQGVWDKIKAVIPNGQSPIASYYFVAYNKNRQEVKPTKPLQIQFFNNYFKDSQTFFYPLTTEGKIDTSNQKKWTKTISTPLPINDPGLVVTIDKVISKDNPNLHLTVKTLKTPLVNGKPQSSIQNILDQTINLFKNPLIYIGIMGIIIVVSLFFYLRKRG